MIKIIPEKIMYAYVALLKNYDKVSKAIEDYYLEPSGLKRAKLLQEIARPLKGGLAERVSKANEVVEHILDHYNTTQKIEHEDLEVDIDIDDGIIEKIVFRNGIGTIKHSPEGLIKRV